MTYTLTGTYALGDLSGREGEHLRFTPSTTIVGAEIILPAPVPVTLAADGTFSVELVGTDDTDYSPAGWVWTVQELMDGGRPAWSFVLTADADIADVTAVNPASVFLTGAMVLVLDALETVPAETPAGTVILRRS